MVDLVAVVIAISSCYVLACTQLKDSEPIRLLRVSQ